MYTLMAMSNCSQADWLVWTRSDFAYQREDWPARRSRMFSLLVHLRRFWNLFVDLPVAKIDLSKVDIWQSLSIGRWPNFSGQQILLGFSDLSYPGKCSGTVRRSWPLAVIKRNTKVFECLNMLDFSLCLGRPAGNEVKDVHPCSTLARSCSSWDLCVILPVAKGDFPKVETGRVPPLASHASHEMTESRSSWEFLIRPS